MPQNYFCSPLFSRLTFSYFVFSWICRLSKRVLRPGRELRLLPSGTPIFAGPDPSRSPFRALLRPHGHPPWKYGPPPARAPPLQRRAALLWYHVPPSGGLSQPGARHPGAPAQHLLRGVRPQSTLYLTVTQRQRIQQPPVPPALRNERGHSVVAFLTERTFKSKRFGKGGWRGLVGVGARGCERGDVNIDRVRAAALSHFWVDVFIFIYLILHLIWWSCFVGESIVDIKMFESTVFRIVWAIHSLISPLPPAKHQKPVFEKKKKMGKTAELPPLTPSLWSPTAPCHPFRFLSVAWRSDQTP